MRIVLTLAAGALLIAAAPVKIIPAPADDKPAEAVGAAARAKHGPEPLARPPQDAGAAEDPAPITLPPPAQPQPR